MSEPVIRFMRLRDVDAVASIEQETFARPWSRDSFRQEITRNAVARYLVAEEDGTILGYAGAWVILDESHITNIAVREAARGRGIGKKLTAELLQVLSNLGACYATLEVRESNLAARAMYEKLGFFKVGRRKRYYEDNGEDALIMVCDALPAPEEDFEEPETVRE